MASGVLPRVWAVIPARGGSKGIAKKNLQKVGGRPLIARAIGTAQAAGCIERTIVTSDDTEILEAAKGLGADVVMRPAEISGDKASSEAAIAHALDALERGGAVLPDLIAFLQCTSPFLKPADLMGTVKALIDQDADTALSAARSHGFHWRLSADGVAVAVGHDSGQRSMRQDKQAEYRESGGVYVMRTKGFRLEGHRFFGKTILYEIAIPHAIEIDDPEDLMIAQAVAPLLDCGRYGPLLPNPLGAVVFDFDGVMTDNRVIQSEDGREAVNCSRADGMGIEMMRQAGIRLAVLSRERNPTVAARCRKLQIECRQGVDEKLDGLKRLAHDFETNLDHIVYVGNDLNDLDCVRAVKLGVAVADAHPILRLHAGLVLTSMGGFGAIRELADIVLSVRYER